ncbi:sensor histidine kinase [Mycetocola spongiae]|uniref:sensor histidine kinase n=1 Tax=Mycetocola spongiae TaxID=2859226 RepID=UPI001CF2D205|nr:histidine kinase [Mycetocola spongiae]UCR88152.1 hypothetical protein KXZ72_09115 [Mycetocola spongiae]
MGSILFTSFLALCTFLLAALPIGQHQNHLPNSLPAILSFIGLLPMLGVCVMLFWRRQIPLALTLTAAGVAAGFPSTPLPALIGLGLVVATRRGGQVWLAAAAAALAVTVTTIWDTAAGDQGWIGLFSGAQPSVAEVQAHLPWLIPLLILLQLAPFIGVGLIRRARRERDSARSLSLATAERATALSGEVSRQQERQEVAREIHDTLASRLSSLSLHAGALELSATESDRGIADAARVVRESAQNSLDDLRHVVEVLRNPVTGFPIGAGRTGLADITALLDEAGASTGLRSSIVLSDPQGCDPAVAHACFRLIQEALSNARRHAPGAAIRLSLQGGPGTGLSLRVVNDLVHGSVPSSVGGGHGLLGMRERAALVGGTFSAQPTLDDTFTLTAWLPWVAAPTTAEPTAAR